MSGAPQPAPAEVVEHRTTNVHKTERPATGRLTSPVLVGREEELSTLLDAASHPPSLVLLEGEAGVGKTRLLEELLQSSSLDSRSYVGRCLELSEPLPLAPFVEALRGIAVPDGMPAVVGALRPLVPELADRLPPEPAAINPRQSERHRLFRALRSLLEALGPTVLVIEDLHWADEATLDFLHFLVPEPSPELALVCAYRREQVPPQSTLWELEARIARKVELARVRLDPLSQQGVRALVGRILDTDQVSAEFAEYLFERTAGLPFAVEEVLLLLKQRHDLVERRGSWVRRELEELGVPAGLRDALLARLRRLPQATKAVVEAASVLAGLADEAILKQMLQMPEDNVRAGLSEATAGAFLFEEGGHCYGFRHALARQAVYESIPAATRRTLHLRAANELEQRKPQPAGALAFHYRAAAQTQRWVHFAEAAAKRALSLNEHAMACHYLEAAATESSLEIALRGRLALELARSARHCGRQAEALKVVEDLLDQDGLKPALRAQLRFSRGRDLLYDLGDSVRGLAEVKEVIPCLGHVAAADALAWLARSRASGASLQERLRWLDDAADLAERSDDRALKIRVAANRAVTLLLVGDSRGAQAIEQIPMPGSVPAEEDEAACGFANIADALLHLGHYGRAREVATHALELARRSAPGIAPVIGLTGLQLDWMTGQWEGLEKKLLEAVEAAEDRPRLAIEATAILGLVLLAKGHVRDARECFKRIDQYPDDLSQTWLLAASSRLSLEDDQSDEAIDLAICGVQSLAASGGWVAAGEVMPVAVSALLARQKVAIASRLVRRFGTETSGRDTPAAAAAYTYCRGLMAEAEGFPEKAAIYYLRAENAWRRLPQPYNAARAHARAGIALLGNAPEHGRALTAEALAAFAGLGASWDAELLRHAMRTRGFAFSHRRGRQGYGDHLSPREAQIARLATSGLSNREIASALFLSIKTVERHIGSINRKLKVSSRREYGNHSAAFVGDPAQSQKE